MKIEEQQFLLDVAVLASKRSKAVRMKVGGSITDYKGNLVAYGYNGSIHGSDEPLEIIEYPESSGISNLTHYPLMDSMNRPYRLRTDENVVVHCEKNLVAHAARRGISIDGGTAYLTLSPCTSCTSLLIQSGIIEVVFLEKYRLFQDTEKLYGNRIKLTHWRN
jgi:dCMP deaminase